MPGCQWRKRGGKAREQSWTPRRPAALRVWGSGRQLARRGVLGKPAGSPVRTAWDSAVRSPRRLLNGQNPPPCPKWLFPGEQHCWGRAGWSPLFGVPPRPLGTPSVTGLPRSLLPGRSHWALTRSSSWPSGQRGKVPALLLHHYSIQFVKRPLGKFFSR